VVESLNIFKAFIEEKVAGEKEKAKSRLSLYRQNRPPKNIKGKTVVLVDDGLTN